MWAEQCGHRCCHCLRGFALDFADQRESRLALNNAHDGLSVVLADDGIGLPVADPAACFDNDWAILDGQAVWNDAAPFSLAVAFLALLLTAQTLPERAAC